jgi:aspartate/methionine/tyrosine aminotransferase
LNAIDTCVNPLSLDALFTFSADSKTATLNTSTPISYGSVIGQPQLRERIVEFYQSQLPLEKTTDLHVAITQGTISANYLVLDTFLRPGDHVIVQYPTYQQLFSVPRRGGVDVSLWKSDPENNWSLDTEELRRLVAKGKTKMIVINSPNNPTGALIPSAVLDKIVEIAAENDILILADEIFRPMYHGASPDTELPPSMTAWAGTYKNIISTGSLSKGFSLPGLRIGWVVSPNPQIIDEINLARDYVTLSVSGIDQEIASFALSPDIRGKILSRSTEICASNLSLLANFVEKWKSKGRLNWVKPVAGASAFVQVFDPTGQPVDDKEYCENMIRETGLLIIPGGYTFGNGEVGNDGWDFKGYLRVGFVCEQGLFREALRVWGEYLGRD